ncbi:MAG: hypothetical protein A2V81_01270 [Candidatus Abawacabacteria bacterium RBG_16_42_10]|uniref:EamA domain-containing protein n=1 Tax=Candidatus Abawacabacteria bacterium RBG_16_42_10 TaxID=1817814 RepID=A0A1F4XIN7_9BACT|nr:MAG: hypothetical protein A2V81_01270 [Candidatus Abawacabacteria bacterium RBG_16_42_10]
MLTNIILVVIAALCNSLAQASLKQATIAKSFSIGFNQQSLIFILTSPLIWIGLALYFVAFFLSIKIFEKMELSFVSPFFMALTFLLVFIFGNLIFKEALTANKVFGAIIILVGIFVLTRGA